MMDIIAKIFARTPPAICMALGGIGMLLGIGVGKVIFFTGVGLQILWIAITKK